MQTLRTKVKLLLQEQSDNLGLYCLSKRVLKTISRQQNRTGDICCDLGLQGVFIKGMSDFM